MIVNPFKGKLRCYYCNGGMKKKNERGKVKFCCTNYDLRNGKCNVRNIVEGSQIRSVIQNRYGEVSDEQITEIINEIIVRDKLLFEIKVNTGEESILFSENHIRY